MPDFIKGFRSGTKGRFYLDNLYPAEAHDYWEIILILEGTGYMQVEDHQYPFKPGTIFCIPPHKVHQNVPDDYYADYCLGIHKYLVPGEDVNVFEDDADHNFLNLLKLYHFVNTRKPVNAENILESIETLLQHILIFWLDRRPNPELLELGQVIRRNSSNPEFKVSDAIDAIPMNDDYIRRQFRELYGCTPVAYLNKLRIQHACRFLLATNLSVGELAYRCGFNDPKYFTRIFTRATGLSPKEYRRTNMDAKDHRQKNQPIFEFDE